MEVEVVVFVLDDFVLEYLKVRGKIRVVTLFFIRSKE